MTLVTVHLLRDTVSRSVLEASVPFASLTSVEICVAALMREGILVRTTRGVDFAQTAWTAHFRDLLEAFLVAMPDVREAIAARRLAKGVIVEQFYEQALFGKQATHRTLVTLAASGYCAWDASFRLQVQRHLRRPVLGGALVALVAIVCGVDAVLYVARWSLPLFVSHNVFQPAFSRGATPALALVIFVTLGVVLARTRAQTALRCWLMLALLTLGLDAISMSLNPLRYTLNWYLGRVETLFTASVVLIALVREITSLYERLAQLTPLDPLTGIRNRRGLQEMLQYTLDSLRRHRACLGILVVDIDHFKLYNDHYGHIAGDAALRMVASGLNESLLRSTDVVARYGGEEFVVLLPSTDEAAVAQVAERLRIAIQSLQIPHAASPSSEHLTVSIGAAAAVGTQSITPGELFKRADDALFQAKTQGRNCVAMRGRETEPLWAVA